jgi:hypothetical protein
MNVFGSWRISIKSRMQSLHFDSSSSRPRAEPEPMPGSRARSIWGPRFGEAEPKRICRAPDRPRADLAKARLTCVQNMSRCSELSIFMSNLKLLGPYLLRWWITLGTSWSQLYSLDEDFLLTKFRCRTLHKMYMFIKAQQDRNKIKQLFCNSEMNTLLKDCHAGLNQALEVFKVWAICSCSCGRLITYLQINTGTAIFNNNDMRNTAEIMHKELLQLIPTISGTSTISDRSLLCKQFGSLILTVIQNKVYSPKPWSEMHREAKWWLPSISGGSYTPKSLFHGRHWYAIPTCKRNCREVSARLCKYAIVFINYYLLHLLKVLLHSRSLGPECSPVGTHGGFRCRGFRKLKLQTPKTYHCTRIGRVSLPGDFKSRVPEKEEARSPQKHHIATWSLLWEAMHI